MVKLTILFLFSTEKQEIITVLSELRMRSKKVYYFKQRRCTK